MKRILDLYAAMQEWPRAFETIVEDELWPGGSMFMMEDPLESPRHYAIAKVLCNIPDDDYEALKEEFQRCEWFLPHERNRGGVMPFFTTVDDDGEFLPYAKVVYLSPLLDRAAWDVVAGVVAHEMAHLVLRHQIACSAREGGEQEKAAWEKVEAWGFGREARKARAVQKWRDSWDQWYCRKLAGEV